MEGLLPCADKWTDNEISKYIHGRAYQANLDAVDIIEIRADLYDRWFNVMPLTARFVRGNLDREHLVVPFSQVAICRGNNLKEDKK